MPAGYFIVHSTVPSRQYHKCGRPWQPKTTTSYLEIYNPMNCIKNLDYKKLTATFHIENAKLAALLMAICIFAVHCYFYVNYDNDVKCDRVLKSGRPFPKMWQPNGCMLHNYNNKDANVCMQNSASSGERNRLVFVGDSRIRQLYQEVVSLFQPDINKTEKKHSHMEYIDDKISLQLQFRWHPTVDESMKADFEIWVDAEAPRLPSLIVAGSGTWTIKKNKGSSEARTSFLNNLTETLPLLEKLQTKVIWMLQDDVIETLLSKNRSMITNDQLTDYNSDAVELFNNSGVSIWSSNRLVSQAYPALNGDGLHLSDKAIRTDTQLLMNYYCNRHVKYFDDATCCRPQQAIAHSQIAIGIFYALVIIAAIGVVSWRASHCKHKVQPPINVEEGKTKQLLEEKTTKPEVARQAPRNWWPNFATSFARFSIVMIYMFICDRTSVFMRESRQIDLVSFSVAMASIFVLGVIFSKKLEGKNASFLNRSQTEEWKGWMQLTILFYHITGLSAVLPVYAGIRALLSAYVFLNGYAHTTYLLSGGAFSFQRLCKQLFRLNFLVIMMCLTMNRPYMSYYFMPLITFWFLLVFFAFAIPPRPIIKAQEKKPSAGVDDGCEVSVGSCRSAFESRPIANSMIRLFLLFSLISILHYSEPLFQHIFSWAPIKFLWVTPDDSLHEWRFRWELDRYSALGGSAFAVVAAVLKQQSLLPDTDSAVFRPRSAYFVVIIGSLSVLVGYAIRTALLCTNKVACNEVHPWIVGPVILSYILLRNLTCSAIRSRYSTFHAWFGHISLELFLAQYHIWLAADSRGVLILIPNLPALNVIVTSFLFVCAAHELQLGSGRLTDLLIPS